MSNNIAVLKREERIGHSLDLLYPGITEGLPFKPSHFLDSEWARE
jgi:hypothetical protein